MSYPFENREANIQRIEMNKLHPKIAAMVDSGHIRLYHAFVVSRLPQEQQLFFYDELIAVSTFESRVNAMAEQSKT